ncbi:probable trehalase [Phalaenopsis equestris]|uniref:probable trehalase n=1 Tax=Phalaenopsis equestris TaxID=78828 RepID=UPI0009E225EC|nr:probable trehalase [Phalaenopsis equestris]
MTVKKPLLLKMSFQSIHFCTFLFSSLLVMSISSASHCTDGGPTFPTTPLLSFLQLLQSEALKTLGPKSFDPKPYVDLPLKKDFGLTEVAFSRLPRINGIIPTKDLNEFLKAYFGDAGDDLVYTEPKDFVSEPEGFLPKVLNPKARVWALEVHSLWKNLSRRVSENVKKYPDRHTLLPLPEPVIIPGSRFKEVYYWDSYWIIRGLLTSKMYDTAKAVANNLLWLVDIYGHVLNGARTYYANRSQPPLLSSMVREIYSRTGDLEFVRKSLPSLIKEHSFWISGSHKVAIRDHHGHEHSLSRYYARWNKPRPESATIDVESASIFLNDSDKEVFYREVASAAETGWDFSSRWLSDPLDKSTVSTTSIIPVDLNTYLYKVELDITFFAQKLGDFEIAEKFLQASRARQLAMRSILWNAEMNQWLDYWLRPGDCEDVHQFEAGNQNDRIFASNFIPVWNWRHTSGEDRTMVESILESFQDSGLLKPAGISTSLSISGQQWDFPNGWSPLQHMIIEGFSNSGSKAARILAEDIAVRWIRTNFAAYNTTGAMHEKYDVEGCGMVGAGGEYAPQTGFGWSNGVVLALLEEFGWPFDRDIGCPS